MTFPAFRDSGASPLRLETHVEDLLGEAQGFGSLLFDSEGRVVEESGETWLYTTLHDGERWTSWARRLHLDSLALSAPVEVLAPGVGEDRAVLHHVFLAREGLVVGFYSNGRGVRVATAPGPRGPFQPLRSFALDPEPGWESRGQALNGWSLEANGAFVPCGRANGELVFWEGYDSYRRDGRLGDLGWAQIRLELEGGEVALLQRHPGNPLAFRPEAWACARCGGNLASGLRIRDRHAFFYYARPDTRSLVVALALSRDPLFQEVEEIFDLGGPLGREALIEKFQAHGGGGKIDLFYESQFADGSWRTGLRRYRVL